MRQNLRRAPVQYLAVPWKVGKSLMYCLATTASCSAHPSISPSVCACLQASGQQWRGERRLCLRADGMDAANTRGQCYHRPCKGWDKIC